MQNLAAVVLQPSTGATDVGADPGVSGDAVGEFGFAGVLTDAQQLEVGRKTLSAGSGTHDAPEPGEQDDSVGADPESTVDVGPAVEDTMLPRWDFSGRAADPLGGKGANGLLVDVASDEDVSSLRSVSRNTGDTASHTAEPPSQGVRAGGEHSRRTVLESMSAQKTVPTGEERRQVTMGGSAQTSQPAVPGDAEPLQALVDTGESSGGLSETEAAVADHARPALGKAAPRLVITQPDPEAVTTRPRLQLVFGEAARSSGANGGLRQGADGLTGRTASAGHVIPLDVNATVLPRQGHLLEAGTAGTQAADPMSGAGPVQGVDVGDFGSSQSGGTAGDESSSGFTAFGSSDNDQTPDGGDHTVVNWDRLRFGRLLQELAAPAESAVTNEPVASAETGAHSVTLLGGVAATTSVTGLSDSELGDANVVIAQRVVEQVARTVVLQRSGDSSEIVVRLDPPELGRIHLAVTQDGDGLSARLHASNEQVRTLLNTHAPLLVDALAGEGLRLESISVHSGSQLGNFDGGASGDAQSGGFEQRSARQDTAGAGHTAQGLFEASEDLLGMLDDTSHNWLA